MRRYKIGVIVEVPRRIFSKMIKMTDQFWNDEKVIDFYFKYYHLGGLMTKDNLRAHIEDYAASSSQLASTIEASYDGEKLDDTTIDEPPQWVDAYQNWPDKADQLGRKAPDYPEIYTEEKDGVFYLTCWVAFEYSGVMYKRLYVESGYLNEFTTKEGLRERFEHYVNLTKTKAAPNFLDVIVKSIL
jgi:hypothetical protein